MVSWFDDAPPQPLSRAMLDRFLRRHLDGPLAPLGARLAAWRLRALALTLAAFVCGVVAMFDVGHHAYFWGLGMLVAGRVFDGLDGPLARREGATGFGAYLDLVLSFIVGAGLPFAFALAEPDRALAAMFAMFGLVVRAAAGAGAGKTELFVGMAIACLFPQWFSLAAYALGIMSFLECGSRVAAAAVREI
jgi:phosphatidylserine synthase